MHQYEDIFTYSSKVVDFNFVKKLKCLTVSLIWKFLIWFTYISVDKTKKRLATLDLLHHYRTIMHVDTYLTLFLHSIFTRRRWKNFHISCSWFSIVIDLGLSLWRFLRFTFMQKWFQWLRLWALFFQIWVVVWIWKCKKNFIRLQKMTINLIYPVQ